MLVNLQGPDQRSVQPASSAQTRNRSLSPEGLCVLSTSSFVAKYYHSMVGTISCLDSLDRIMVAVKSWSDSVQALPVFGCWRSAIMILSLCNVRSSLV